MNVSDIANEILPLIEPDETQRDDTLYRLRIPPSKLVPGITYLWLRRETFGPDGQGPIERRSFWFRVAWVSDHAAGTGGIEDERAVSTLIAARAEAIRAVVDVNRAGDHFEWLQTDQIDYESLAATEVRGFYLDLSGWVGPGHD